MDGWNSSFLLGSPISRGEPLVSGSVHFRLISEAMTFGCFLRLFIFETPNSSQQFTQQNTVSLGTKSSTRTFGTKTFYSSFGSTSISFCHVLISKPFKIHSTLTVFQKLSGFHGHGLWDEDTPLRINGWNPKIPPILSTEIHLKQKNNL